MDDIYKVFIHFFGEEYVDKRDSSIIVYFPKVEIENEEGNKHTILDLYAKIDLYHNLFSSLTFTRTTFTTAEFYNGYIHSHTHRFRDFPAWLSPCLGKGPLAFTTVTLSSTYDLDIWSLFCIELSNYVKVESLEGNPYVFISTLSKYQERYSIALTPIYSCDFQLIGELVKFIFSKDILKYSIINNSIVLAHDLYSLYLLINKAFFQFIETSDVKELEEWKPYIFFGKIDQNKEIIIPNNSFDTSEVIGKPVLKFKEEIKTLKIIKQSVSESFYPLLDLRLFKYIIHAITNIVNVTYGNPNNKKLLINL